MFPNSFDVTTEQCWDLIAVEPDCFVFLSNLERNGIIGWLQDDFSLFPVCHRGRKPGERVLKNLLIIGIWIGLSIIWQIIMLLYCIF